MNTPETLPTQFLHKGWIRRALAWDANNLPVSPAYSGAVRWCLMGAFAAAMRLHEPPKEVMEMIHDEIRKRFPLFLAPDGSNHARELSEIIVTGFNDVKGRKKAEVMEVARAVEKRLGWRDIPSSRPNG